MRVAVVGSVLLVSVFNWVEVMVRFHPAPVPRVSITFNTICHLIDWSVPFNVIEGDEMEVRVSESVPTASNEFVSTWVTPLLFPVKIYPVPAVSIERLLNVATPLVPVTVVVPPNVAPCVPLPDLMRRDTEPAKSAKARPEPTSVREKATLKLSSTVIVAAGWPVTFNLSWYCRTRSFDASAL
jgi:hypothetical protein